MIIDVEPRRGKRKREREGEFASTVAREKQKEKKKGKKTKKKKKKKKQTEEMRKNIFDSSTRAASFNHYNISDESVDREWRWEGGRD